MENQTPLIDKILEEKEIKQEKNLDSSIESLMERDIDRLTIKRTTKTARINLNPNFSYAIALFLILIGLLINGLSIWMINRIITIAPDFVVLDIGLIFFGVGLFLLSLAIISLTVIGFDLHKRENYWKTTTFTPDAVTINFFLKMKKITIDYSEIENLELSIVGGSLRYRREHIPWDYALFLVIEKKGENKPRYYRMGKTKGIYDDVLHQYCDTILSQVKKFPIAFKKSQVKTYDNRSELEKKIPKILFISSAIAGFIAVALSFMEVFFLNFN